MIDSQISTTVLEPSFVMRIAGLPLVALQPLRFSRTADVLEELGALGQWLQAEAEPLSEALYPIIGMVQDRQLRQRLILLRRAIYQGQRPKQADKPLPSLDDLPAELQARLMTWHACIERRDALLAGGEALLQAEWTEKRRELWQIASTESFQQGVLLASSALFKQLQHKLTMRQLNGAHAGHTLDEEANRKLELGMLLYLSRMAAKTSPFSTFTGSAIGYWVDNGPAVSYTKQPWLRRSGAELNRYIIRRIAQELVHWPEIRSTLSVSVNRSCIEDGTTLRFVERNQVEIVRTIPYSPVLRQVLNLIRSAQDRSYDAIVERIAAEGDLFSVAEISRLLDRMIDLGLLELSWNMPDFALDYLEQMIEHLHPIRVPRTVAVRELLVQLGAGVPRYVHAGQAAARARILQEMHAIVEQIYQQCGIGEEEQDFPTRNFLFENTLVDGVDLRLERPQWETVIDDLALYQQLLDLYDPHMPARLAATGFFSARYGSETPISLLDFYAVCTRETSLPGLLPTARTIAPAGAAHEAGQQAWQAGQARIRDLRIQLAERIAALPPDEQGVKHLDPDVLRELLADELRPARHRSNALFTQILLQDGSPRLVVNGIQTGWSRNLGRLKRLEAQISGQGAPVQVADSADDGPILAGMGGMFGGNIGLQFVQRVYEVVFPGFVSLRPPEEQIPLNDLQVVYDRYDERLKLISVRLQREIMPIYLSMVSSIWLPPLYRFVLAVFSEGPSNPIVFMLSTPPGQSPTRELSIRHTARLCCGHLIVERARWEMPVAHVPVRQKQETMFAFLLRLRGWRAENHLPDECFVRAVRVQPSSVSASSPPAKERRWVDKPLYVDFQNPFYVMLFEREIKQPTQTIILEEVLPSQQDLWLSDGQDTYVQECIFELTTSAAL